MSADRQLVLKEGDLFAVLSESGQADGQGTYGVYSRDTRHVSLYRLFLSGDDLALLGARSDEPYAARLWMTNRGQRDARRGSGFTLSLHRLLVVTGQALLESLTLTNHAPEAAEVEWGAELACDFRDMMAVRGYPGMKSPAGEVKLQPEDGAAVFRYTGGDGLTRITRVVARPQGQLQLLGDRLRILWRRHLAPGERADCELRVEARLESQVSGSGSEGNGDGAFGDARRALESLKRSYDEWRRECARFETACGALNALIARGVTDLRALASDFGEGPFPVAGIPWFAVPFGRDGLWTGWFCLATAPVLARSVLFTLAHHQARADDPWVDAEPGKILHELRFGELTRLGLLPFGPYYGSVDATPLFALLSAEYLLHTGNRPDFERLMPALERAMAWVERYGDANRDGFVEYRRRSGGGLEHQAWRDSWDSTWHADGRMALPPISPVEAQAYVYRAYRSLARCFRWLGDAGRAAESDRQAEALRERFEQRFWLEDLGWYAMGLDGEGRPLAVLTSNGAHALWAGIASAQRAAAVARRLMQPDFFSGWGLRTVAAGQARYNPMSYHNGSVWPHDTAIAVAGLAAYGHLPEASRLARAVVEASGYFSDARLPELFCGFSADQGPPVPYPTACSPQAWSAATPLSLVTSLLGLRVDGPGRRVVVADRAPSWLLPVRIEGLAVGTPPLRVDLRVEPSEQPPRGQPDVPVPVVVRRLSGRVEVALESRQALHLAGVPPSRG